MTSYCSGQLKDNDMTDNEKNREIADLLIKRTKKLEEKLDKMLSTIDKATKQATSLNQ